MIEISEEMARRLAHCSDVCSGVFYFGSDEAKEQCLKDKEELERLITETEKAQWLMKEETYDRLINAIIMAAGLIYNSAIWLPILPWVLVHKQDMRVLESGNDDYLEAIKDEWLRWKHKRCSEMEVDFRPIDYPLNHPSGISDEEREVFRDQLAQEHREKKAAYSRWWREENPEVGEPGAIRYSNNGEG